MPPWHIDKTVGVQEFKNDRSLTRRRDRDDRRVDRRRARVEGDPVRPSAARWSSRTRTSGGSRTEFGRAGPRRRVRALHSRGRVTQDKWWRPVTPTGLTEPRWVKAIEIKPAGQRWASGSPTMCSRFSSRMSRTDAIEHRQPSQASTRGGAMGGRRTVHGVGRRQGRRDLPGWSGQADDARLTASSWEVHLHAIGKEVQDSYVEIGVWFYPEGTGAHSTARGSGSSTPPSSTGTRHSSRRSGGHAELPQAALAGASGELPAAHAHAR